jgi:hypothetical protein
MKSTIEAEFRNWRRMKAIRQFDGSAPTYWIAKLVGFTANSFKREFIKPVIDFSQANSVESRGVHYYWHVDDGLYEGVFCRNFERQFFIADSGKIEYIDKDSAKIWLSDYLESQSLMQRKSE